jgi:hypothetical protein
VNDTAHNLTNWRAVMETVFPFIILSTIMFGVFHAAVGWFKLLLSGEEDKINLAVLWVIAIIIIVMIDLKFV